MKKSGLAGSFWPSTQQELILRTIALQGESARVSWERLVAVIDLDRLEEGSYALMPQLYRKLTTLGIDAPAMPRLKGIHRRTWYANQLFLERAGVLLRACAERAVEPIVMGDAALGARAYGDTGAREIAQLEVLVRGEDQTAAVDAFGQAGWRMSPDRISGLIARRGAARIVDEGRRALIAQVTLLPEFSLTAPVEETFGAATRGEIAGSPALLLDPADELVRLCALGARRTFWRSVVWTADAAMLVPSQGAAFNWDRVLATATAAGATLAIGDALRYLSDVLQVPVPAALVERLAAVSAGKKELAAHRLAGGAAGSAGAALAPLLRTGDGRLGPTMRRIPGFLRDRLSVDRARDVPVEVVRRTMGRVAVRRKRERER